MKSATTKRCEFCNHSRAAHTDGIRCALCTCASAPRDYVQQSLTFRGTVPAATITRKR